MDPVTIRDLLSHTGVELNWDAWPQLTQPVRYLRHVPAAAFVPWGVWHYQVDGDEGLFNLREDLVDETVIQKAVAAGIPVS